MLLFISTEVMMFTAIFASYIVLRFSGTQAWPANEQVGVNATLGWINTAILLLSGITMWWAVRQCSQDAAASCKRWLLVTFLFGLSFLGVKAYEYKSKYDHGVFPSYQRSLIYDVADENYLSRAVAEMRQEIRRLEQRAADGKLTQKQDRLDDLYLLQAGIVDWTQFVVGRSGDPLEKQAAISALAHQIYHHEEDSGVSQYMASEQSKIEAEKHRLKQALDNISGERSVAQKRLQELLPKKDSGDEEVRIEYGRVADKVSRLTEQIAELGKEMRPVEDRLLAIEKVGAGAGINQTYQIRLPIVIPGGHKWSSLYYLLTGAHAIHLIGGLVAMLVLFARRLTVRWLGVLENLSLYWHFVDVVWLVVFAVIYLA